MQRTIEIVMYGLVILVVVCVVACYYLKDVKLEEKYFPLATGLCTLVVGIAAIVVTMRSVNIAKNALLLNVENSATPIRVEMYKQRVSAILGLKLNVAKFRRSILHPPMMGTIGVISRRDEILSALAIAEEYDLLLPDGIVTVHPVPVDLALSL